MSEDPAVQGGLTEDEKRDNVIRLAFGGDRSLYDAFCDRVRQALPPDTAVVLRGSAVTGKRWDDGAPFDADGPGTSDLDLTLVGAEAVGLFDVTRDYVPFVN
jgi:predicted nucleotidyltransferase